MERVVKQAHFLGTVKLLELTRELPAEKRDELLKYISHLEKSQLFLAKSIDMFVDGVTNRIPGDFKHCYFCHGQKCEKCS